MRLWIQLNKGVTSKFIIYIYKDGWKGCDWQLIHFGRAEINIKPWDSLLRELKEGNNGRNWVDREPYAYWKGNPFVAETRRDLLTCNLSDKHDWNARLYVQVILFLYYSFLF